ncbi:MAG: hypothetical protein ACYC6L_11350, partial [Anaerolineae bacterium]
MKNRESIFRNFTPVGILILVTILTYGFVIQLPFYFDDMTHFRWLDTHGLVAIVTSAQTPGYYRPLPFLIWKALVSVWGGYNAPLLHIVNLILHGLNALLVYTLVAKRAQSAKRFLGLAAALLFTLYPFTYQSIPFVGSLTHPLVLALMLGSIL